MEKKEIPKEYICPINFTIMKNPVIDQTNGHSYEREALVHWVQRNNNSPQTRVPLRVNQLISNRAQIVNIEFQA